MSRTLRVRTRAGWTTKLAPDIPENRLTAEEVDDTFLDLWDSMAVCVLQEASEPLPTRPNALVVFWFSWDEPPSSTDNPYDQWFEIPEIVLPAAPAAPTSLVATAGDGEVNLAWTVSATTGANAPTGQRVYRHTSNSFAGASQLGSDLGSGDTSYTDATTTNDTEYFYWVTAFNATGESAESTGDSATPAAVSVDIIADIGWRNAYLADNIAISNGAEVTTWADDKAALDLTSATGPQYNTSDANFNSLPCVQFSGTDEFMATAQYTQLTQPCSLAYVGNFDSVNEDVVALERLAPAGVIDTGFALTNGDPKVRSYAGVPANSTVDASTTTAQLVIVNADGASSEIIVNGVSTSVDLGTREHRQIFLGRNVAGTKFPAFKMSFVGLKTSALLTAQEITDIEAWAADKYGITIA